MAGVEAMEVDNNASEEVSESAATATSTASSKPAPSTGESSKKGSYELPWYVCNASNVMDDHTWTSGVAWLDIYFVVSCKN